MSCSGEHTTAKTCHTSALPHDAMQRQKQKLTKPMASSSAVTRILKHRPSAKKKIAEFSMPHSVYTTTASDCTAKYWKLLP